MNHYKNIIITGASSGIGKALAIEYSQNCHNLLLIGRNINNLKITKQQCHKNCNIILAKADVKNFQDTNKYINSFDNDFPVDLIIANAGISAGTGTKGENLAQLKEIYDINIYGVINCIYPLIDKMRQRETGHIAIMSSMSAFTPIPSAPAYSSSKQCVSFLGLALKQDLKKSKVKLSVIYPGFIKTPMTDANKFKMPLLMDVEKAAKKIMKDLSKNKTKIIFPKRIYYITRIFNLFPSIIKQIIYDKTPAKDNLSEEI